MADFKLLSIRLFLYLNLFTLSVVCEVNPQTWVVNVKDWGLTKTCKNHLLGYNTINQRLSNMEIFIEANKHLPVNNINELPLLYNCKLDYTMKYCTLNVNIFGMKEHLNNITNGNAEVFKRFTKFWRNNQLISLCLPVQCTIDDGVILANIFNQQQQATKQTNIAANSQKIVEYLVSDIVCDVQLSKLNLTTWIFILYSLIVIFINLILVFNLPTKYNRFLECFNLKRHLLKLFKVETSNTFEVIHGLRVLSALWIIYSHVYEVNMQYPHSDSLHIYEWFASYPSVIVLLAPLAVDQFLVFNGFLIGYKKASFGKHLKQRVLRIILPTYPLIFLFHTNLKNLINDPTSWCSRRYLENTCSTYWWTSYLLIHNYYNSYAMCAGQTWYIAVDFQLMLIAPFCLHLLKKYNRTGAIILIFVAFFLCLWTSCIAYDLNLEPTPQSWLPEYYANIYFSTHIRSPVWLISLVIGYFYEENLYNRKTTNTRRINQAKFLLSGLTLCFIAVFTFYAPFVEISRWIKAGYTGFHRLLWSLAFILLLQKVHKDKKSMIYKFLTLKVFKILSELSYCIYLTHPAVQLVYNGSRRDVFQFGLVSNNLDFIQQLFYTLLAALYWYLLIQSVIISLGRLLEELWRNKKKVN